MRSTSFLGLVMSRGALLNIATTGEITAEEKEADQEK